MLGRPVALASVVVGVALLAGPIAADGYSCVNYHTPDVLGVAYVPIDFILGEKGPYSLHVYLESNGEPGVQRGGSSLLTGDPDPCQTAWTEPDTLVV